MTASTFKSVGPELAALLPPNDTPWYKKRNQVFLNFCLACLFLLSSGNGYDGSMLNGLLALPHWQSFMHHPSGAWLGFVSGASSLGAMFFYPVVAWSSNRFGRKPTILVGYIFLCLGVGLQTGATNIPMFVVSRVIVGIASAFFGGCVPLLVTETAYPTHRGVFTSLYMCGWYVGSFLAAWSTYGTRNYDNSWSWRIPSVLQLLLPIVALPGLIMIPESPRFLASKERHQEARAFLVKYHAEDDETSPLAAFELAEITRSIQMERESQKSTTYREMVATAANRRRTFITVFLGVFGQWAGQNVAGYYLAPVLTTIGITTITKQTLINGFLQIWNLVCSLAGAFNVDRVGRRVLFLAATTGMLISYILITALSATFAKGGSATVGTAVVPFLFIMYGCYSLAFTPLLVAYPVEIWPYNLRARGLSSMWVSTAIAVFFNIFINPIALEAIAWKYYLLYVFILAGGGVVIYFAFPETRGHSLEEMARIFEGENASVPKGVIADKIAASGSTSHIDDISAPPNNVAEKV
ncbi:general substrate transporter [Ilyonectria robusta]|uniref:general substrate transporter n=1 Tax=Ilyonectria robusta TaxID=1079257 RepID=UPI001E8CC57A|nr:general substrate transporter [Ilyonectria robusta]KAH8658538.1 general substrate transporter [Ilyonectria robusta]